MKIIPEDMRDNVCKMGQGHDCCRYMVVSGDGISCAKNSQFHKTIDQRVALEKMTARGDNCEGLK